MHINVRVFCHLLEQLKVPLLHTLAIYQQHIRILLPQYSDHSEPLNYLLLEHISIAVPPALVDHTVFPRWAFPNVTTLQTNVDWGTLSTIVELYTSMEIPSLSLQMPLKPQPFCPCSVAYVTWLSGDINTCSQSSLSQALEFCRQGSYPVKYCRFPLHISRYFALDEN